MAQLKVEYLNRGAATLHLFFGKDCGGPVVEAILSDGEDTTPASVTMCDESPKDLVYTVRPGRSLKSTIDFHPVAGQHSLQARYRVESGPAGVFLGEVLSPPLTVSVAPPDPPGPIVELRLPRTIRAGKPFDAEIRHVNRGKRGWILFNERCAGPPRDFLTVDGEVRPVPSRGPCKPEWDDRMTLEPGRSFSTKLRIELPAGRHKIQAHYRLGAEYERAVVWKGEAASEVVEVDVVE